mmetsp:Transcript_10469/g.14522  ORF Transcript_10469/g.14522 Transcript_10469/m.14522 type:complete len:334 (-) Transcript_10469:33-1034(-)
MFHHELSYDARVNSTGKEHPEINVRHQAFLDSHVQSILEVRRGWFILAFLCHPRSHLLFLSSFIGKTLPVRVIVFHESGLRSVVVAIGEFVDVADLRKPDKGLKLRGETHNGSIAGGSVVEWLNSARVTSCEDLSVRFVDQNESEHAIEGPGSFIWSERLVSVDDHLAVRAGDSSVLGNPFTVNKLIKETIVVVNLSVSHESDVMLVICSNVGDFERLVGGALIWRHNCKASVPKSPSAILTKRPAVYTSPVRPTMLNFITHGPDHLLAGPHSNLPINVEGREDATSADLLGKGGDSGKSLCGGTSQAKHSEAKEGKRKSVPLRERKLGAAGG